MTRAKDEDLLLVCKLVIPILWMWLFHLSIY